MSNSTFFRMITCMVSGFICLAELNSQTLRIDAGTKLTNTGYLVLNDASLINNGNILNTNTATVSVSGGGSPVFSGTGTTDLHHLRIAKSQGSTLRLDLPLTIKGNLGMNGGFLDLGSSYTELIPGAMIMGESEQSRIVSSGGGEIFMTIALDQPSGITPGNIGAGFISNQNLGLTTIRRGHTILSDPDGRQSIQRYYKILPANNAGLAATLVFRYFEAELNNIPENQLLLQRQQGANWDKLGVTGLNMADNFLTKDQLSSFSGIYTLSNVLAALPLTLSKFTTHCSNGHANLAWKTQDEVNTARFIVEKSHNSSSWEQIGEIAARNTAGQHSYYFTDRGAAGDYLYRLRMDDIDGSFTYSPVVRSNCADIISLLVGPNPTSGEVKVTLQQPGAGVLALRVVDASGRVVVNRIWKTFPGTNLESIDLSRLAAGVYVIQVSGEGIEKSVRVVRK